VLIRGSDQVTFTEAPSGSGCNPTDPTLQDDIVANDYCEIEMQTIRDNYGLV
jgi:hypothetical protein